MLWIETGIASPKAEMQEEACKQNALVLHLPALFVEPLHSDFSLDSFEAVFVASPRAAKIAAAKILDFQKKNNRAIFALGSGTATALKKENIENCLSGDGSGAETFLQAIKDGLYAPKTLPKKIAWISAEETAADLKALANLFKIDIVHIPVYRTINRNFSEDEVKKIIHPCKWFLRSGKGVNAVSRYFSENDSFEAIGKSAQEALKALSRP